MKSLATCLNWKVLVGLGAVAAGVVLVAPAPARALLPLLLIAACPLSMVGMMFAMRGHGGAETAAPGASPAQPQDSADALRARLVAVREEGARLEGQLAEAAGSTAAGFAAQPAAVGGVVE